MSRAASPARLFIGCLPVRVMLVQALGAYSHGKFEGNWNRGDVALEIEGGPDWVRTDRFTIEAVADHALSHDLMYGPMLREVLEERFHLRTRRDTRDVPMFALTVVKGGLKLARPDDRSCTEPYAGGPPREGGAFVAMGCSKIQQAAEGGCVPVELARGNPARGEKPECGLREVTGQQCVISDLLGSSMAQLANVANWGAGRPVLDKTAITGRFDFHLEFLAPGALPAEDPDGVPSLAGILSQMGLKLEPTHGPRDFLRIESIEPAGELTAILDVCAVRRHQVGVAAAPWPLPGIVAAGHRPVASSIASGLSK